MQLAFFKKKKVSLKNKWSLKTDKESELRLKEPGCKSTSCPLRAGTEDRGYSGTSKVPTVSVESAAHTGSLSLSLQGGRHSPRTQSPCMIQELWRGFSEERGLLWKTWRFNSDPQKPHQHSCGDMGVQPQHSCDDGRQRQQNPKSLVYTETCNPS